jgi:hypothetical protein
MVSDVVIGVIGDTGNFDSKVDASKAKKDALIREWRIERNTLMRQVREGFTLVSSLMSSFRQAMSLFGQQIDPFFSALISMVIATASMLISASTVLAMTGIGGAAALVVFSLAISFQVLTLGKLIADKAETDGLLDKIMNAMHAPRGITQLGGRF